MARILVIDDDDEYRSLIRAILEPAGFEVSEAADGQAGLDLAHESDLIITDILMPGTDGMELIRGVADRRPSMPVIAISGGGTHLPAAFSLAMSRAMGAAKVLEKPFSRNDLLHMVEQLLNDRR